MTRSHRVLYSCFLRLFRRYHQEAIPLTGVVGVLEFANGRPKEFLRSAFRNPGNFSFNLESGFQLLSRLRSQLDTLVSSEEETRKALAEWEQLTADLAESGAAGQTLTAASLAAEQGMDLLVRQSLEMDQLLEGGMQHLLSDDEEEGVQGEASLLTLDTLAAEVQQLYEQLVAAQQPPPHLPAAATALTAEQQAASLKLEALQQVLYSRHKFFYRPFEWVYDGLKPLLLPEVLRRRRGAPLSLAVLGAAVGRRAGLHLTPIPAKAEGRPSRGAGRGGGQPGEASLQQLPPHLASRLAQGAQGALGPSQEEWLLRVEGGDGPWGAAGAAKGQEGTAGGPPGRLRFVDAGSGRLMGEDEAGTVFPATQLAAPGWAELSPLLIWQALVRTLLQAHQRRGESDLVAHWMFVLMALDPFAVEWECMAGEG